MNVYKVCGFGRYFFAIYSLLLALATASSLFAFLLFLIHKPSFLAEFDEFRAFSNTSLILILLTTLILLMISAQISYDLGRFLKRCQMKEFWGKESLKILKRISILFFILFAVQTWYEFGYGFFIPDSQWGYFIKNNPDILRFEYSRWLFFFFPGSSGITTLIIGAALMLVVKIMSEKLVASSDV